jgi:hypothetical protein
MFFPGNHVVTKTVRHMKRYVGNSLYTFACRLLTPADLVIVLYFRCVNLLKARFLMFYKQYLHVKLLTTSLKKDKISRMSAENYCFIELITFTHVENILRAL